MDIDKNINASLKQRTKKISPKIKTFIFILEISLVIILLVLWFSSDSLQKSKNLWVLFFYSFPAEFLVAIVPHEPILLYFGKFCSPLTVALVASGSTLLTEILNYSAFKFVTDLKIFEKMRHRKTVNKIVELFNKSPFIALLVAGFTPIPFYPFRFLVVLAHYPITKYVLAVFLSRTPRFYILAFVGHMIKIPDYLLIALFAVLIAAINIPFMKNILKKKRNKKNNAS